MPTRMRFSDGSFVYPCYCDGEQRKAVKERLETTGIKMYCGCRSDMQLEYKISSDLRFIPAHKMYEHARGCDRCETGMRSSAYIPNEYGEIKAYLGFDFRNFSFPVKKDEEQETSDNADSKEAAAGVQEPEKKDDGRNDRKKEKKAEKAPNFKLDEFVKELNHDTYLSRIKDGKYAYLTREYYRNAVAGRLKYVFFNGCRKPVSELDIKTDGVKFFYSPICACTDHSLIFSYKDSRYSVFVPDLILERQMAEFEKRYETSVMDYINHGGEVIAAGFKYRRKNKAGKEYCCIGRLVLFCTCRYGLYSSSKYEMEILDVLLDYCRENNALLLFPENAEVPYNWLLSIRGNEIPIYEKFRIQEKPDGFDKVIELGDCIVTAGGFKERLYRLGL